MAKETRKTYRMYSGEVKMTRSERMEKNYLPGIDREPGSFSRSYIPHKEFFQSKEMRAAKMAMLKEWMKRVNK